MVAVTSIAQLKSVQQQNQRKQSKRKVERHNARSSGTTLVGAHDDSLCYLTKGLDQSGRLPVTRLRRCRARHEKNSEDSDSDEFERRRVMRQSQPMVLRGKVKD
jgi:hypothetical protein